MKKKLVMLLVGLMTVMLVGCGSTEVESSVAESTQESSVVASTVEESKAESKAEPTEASEVVPESSEEESPKVIVGAGPAYVVANLQDSVDYYVDETDFGIAMQVNAAELNILSPGYDHLKAAIAELNKEAITNADAALENARDFIAEGNLEYAYFPWEEETYISAVRSDSQVFAFSMNCYGYTGGAHGYYYSEGFNFEPETGKLLKLGDVVTDLGKLQELVAEQIIEEYGEDCLFDSWADTLAYDFEDPDTMNFLLGEDYLIIWFDTYELAPYSTGEVAAMICLGDEEELFNQAYFHEVIDNGEEVPEAATTEFYEKVVMPLSEKLGVWSFNEVKAFLDGTGYEYQESTPGIEDDGDFRLVDPENGAVFYAFCWTRDIENDEDYEDPEKHYLDSLNYRAEKKNTFIECVDHTEYLGYFISNEEYQTRSFTILPELNLYLFGLK